MTDSQATTQATDVPSASAADIRTAGSTTDRDQFGAEELAIVLSHFDLGPIEVIREFPRGSRRSPKLVIRAEKGDFLLKRRARGKDDAFRVAFAHSLQMHLAAQQFPLPHLVGTRRDNNSMLQCLGGIYELFEYIQGTGFDNSLDAAEHSGQTLGVFHKHVRDFQPEFEPPTGSYHANRRVMLAFDQLPAMLAQVDPHYARTEPDRIEKTGTFLRNAYQAAALRVNDDGLPDWPMQIIHSDWHPGNMLFRGPRVVAVIDYDAARLAQRIFDVANGVLQFSILGGGDDASQWPDYLDEARYKRFLRGYDGVNVLSKRELKAVPWLMLEALIAESVVPIAATGSFARMEGFGFLQMIDRKVRWLQQHAEKLANILN